MLVFLELIILSSVCSFYSEEYYREIASTANMPEEELLKFALTHFVSVYMNKVCHCNINHSYEFVFRKPLPVLYCQLVQCLR